jgi:hypothetical protein
MKTATSFLALALSLILPATLCAEPKEKDPPQRKAREVEEVAKSYPTTYIIKASEEKEGDHTVSNAPECDIRAVSACNSSKRLRIDLFLHNDVTFKKNVWFGFAIRYAKGVKKTFAYSPTKKTFSVVRSKDGKVTSREEIKLKKGSDWVRIVGSKIKGVSHKANVVTLMIDKDKHISKDGKGKLQKLRIQGVSGYYQKGTGDLKLADYTGFAYLVFRR